MSGARQYLTDPRRPRVSTFKPSALDAETDSVEHNTDIGYGTVRGQSVLRRVKLKEIVEARDARLGRIFIDEEIIGSPDRPHRESLFGEHEEAANDCKRKLRFRGATALAMGSLALAGTVISLYLAAIQISGGWTTALGLATELLGMGSVAVAVYIVRVRRLRARWLDHRFAAERIRQWHFQTLLDGRLLKDALSDPDKFVKERASRLSLWAHSLNNLPGARSEFTVEAETTPSLAHPLSALPSGPEGDAIWALYLQLRLDHQVTHARYKVSESDRPRWWAGFLNDVGRGTLGAAILLSASSLVLETLELLGVGGIGQILQLFSCLALLLVVASVAARAIDDGMGYSKEVEHYEGYARAMADLKRRALSVVATSPSAFSVEAQTLAAHRSAIMLDAERLAVSELNGFLRIHREARFLL